MGDHYDVMVIGGGPAGAAAAIYAARKKLSALLVTESFGGQSVASAGIENWIGTKKIGGAEFAIALEDHVRAQAGIDVREPEKVTSLAAENGGYAATTVRGRVYGARAVIIAAGGRHRRLDVPGGSDFDGRGVAYCSTCDAPVFAGKAVAVIGSGNSGLEAALDLLPYAARITIIDITPAPTGDPQTAEKALGDSKVAFQGRAEATALAGEDWIREIHYRHLDSGRDEKLPVEGVFVAIGSVPNSEFARGLVDLNDRGEIIVSRPDYATSRAGIFAAGDVTDEPFRQNNIAAGDGVKAALSAVAWLARQNG